MPAWLTEASDHITLTLHVQPGAKRTEVVGEHGTALKIRLAAPPVDGQANEELILFLADLFGVPSRQVQLIAGHSGRRKRVAVVKPSRRPDLTW